MSLKSKRFQSASDLINFVNTTPILKANIQQIVPEAASGGFTLFWWA
jgi:hypothetical protein